MPRAPCTIKGLSLFVAVMKTALLPQTLNVRLSEEMATRLRELANDEGESIGVIVRRAIRLLLVTEREQEAG